MQSINSGNPLKVDELKKTWGKELGIELVSGEKGLDRDILYNRVQKPGLRLIEPIIHLGEGKIQVLGRTEISYFEKLAHDDKKTFSDKITSQNIPCIILTKGLIPPKPLIASCRKTHMPLFVTNLSTGRLISNLNSFLEERLAPFICVHGVLIDIHRLCVLIIGKSGIGKSECALDLIHRGSKLISDDVVEIRKVEQSKLIGSGPQNTRHLMEIRGIGIINIKDLFGTASVMDKREIDMVIELSKWEQETDYDRVGLEKKTYSLMEVELPYLVIPVSPGRNTSTIVEVAVRNHLLKLSGVITAEQFDGKRYTDNHEKKTVS